MYDIIDLCACGYLSIHNYSSYDCKSACIKSLLKSNRDSIKKYNIGATVRSAQFCQTDTRLFNQLLFKSKKRKGTHFKEIFSLSMDPTS